MPRIYEFALKLWEQLPQELDYDFLFSQRGVLNLAHTLQDVRESMRRVEANKLNGVDAEWLTPDEVAKVCPDRQRVAGRPLPRCWAAPSSRGRASPSTTTSPGRSPGHAMRWAST